MLRSFSYAAFAGLKQFQETSDSSNIEPWARAWENCASGQFLQTYREVIAQKTDLLPLPQEAQALLDAFVLEKSLYELLYELNNRPAWIVIPIAGILSLCR